eukprot:scpid48052/ scgid7560/ 
MEFNLQDQEDTAQESQEQGSAVATSTYSQDSSEDLSSGAGRKKKRRYGERPQADNGDDELQLSASSPTLSYCIDLPDEIWALIFSKIPNAWYHTHHLATVSRQFSRVATEWKNITCKNTSFDLTSVSSRRIFGRMARKCGQHVKELQLMGEYFMSSIKPRSAASTSVLVQGLNFMPNLAVFNCSMCISGNDITILSALLELQHLQDVWITLAMSLCQAQRDSPFPFTGAAMSTLALLGARTSLRLTIVANNYNGFDNDMQQLLRRIGERAGRLQSLQVYNRFRSSLPMEVNMPSSSYSYLQCLVVDYFDIATDTLLEILSNNMQITQLSVGVETRKLNAFPFYDVEFFETFSRLENKFTLLDTSRWKTPAPCNAFVEMAECFPSLREFSYRYRSHWMDCNSDHPRDGSEDSAEMLVVACPNLSRLAIGGAIGMPSLFDYGLLWERAHQTVRGIVHTGQFGSLATLAKLSGLKSLSLQGMSLSSGKDLQTLAVHCPQLECLQLSSIKASPFTYIPRLSDAISKLPRLKTLSVDDPHLRLQGIFEALEQLEQLETLVLRTKETIPDRVLVRFFDSSPSPLNFVHIVCTGPKLGMTDLMRKLSERRPHSRLRVNHSGTSAAGFSGKCTASRLGFR